MIPLPLIDVIENAVLQINRADALDDMSGLTITPVARQFYPNLRALKRVVDHLDDVQARIIVNRWMKLFALSDAHLREGTIICEKVLPLQYLAEEEQEGPYDTPELNDVFRQAQRGWVPRDDFGDEPFDDHDTREPEGWAEYLAPMQPARAARLATWLKKQPDRVRSGEWLLAISEADYEAGDLNVIDLALMVRELADSMPRKRLVEWTRNMRWYSHVDGRLIGNLFQFMIDFEGDLDDIETDLPAPEGPIDEYAVATEASRAFEMQLEAHWTKQAQQHKRVPVENGTKIWAAVWTGAQDVQFNIRAMRAIANGKSLSGAFQRKVVGATTKGLVTDGYSVISWKKAAKMTNKLVVKDREALLATMRKLWSQEARQRPYIEAVGRAL